MPIFVDIVLLTFYFDKIFKKKKHLENIDKFDIFKVSITDLNICYKCSYFFSGHNNEIETELTFARII